MDDELGYYPELTTNDSPYLNDEYQQLGTDMQNERDIFNELYASPSINEGNPIVLPEVTAYGDKDYAKFKNLFEENRKPANAWSAIMHNPLAQASITEARYMLDPFVPIEQAVTGERPGFYKDPLWYGQTVMGLMGTAPLLGHAAKGAAKGVSGTADAIKNAILRTRRTSTKIPGSVLKGIGEEGKVIGEGIRANMGHLPSGNAAISNIQKDTKIPQISDSNQLQAFKEQINKFRLHGGDEARATLSDYINMVDKDNKALFPLTKKEMGRIPELAENIRIGFPTEAAKFEKRHGISIEEFLKNGERVNVNNIADTWDDIIFSPYDDKLMSAFDQSIRKYIVQHPDVTTKKLLDLTRNYTDFTPRIQLVKLNNITSPSDLHRLDTLLAHEVSHYYQQLLSKIIPQSRMINGPINERELLNDLLAMKNVTNHNIAVYSKTGDPSRLHRLLRNNFKTAKINSVPDMQKDVYGLYKDVPRGASTSRYIDAATDRTLGTATGAEQHATGQYTLSRPVNVPIMGSNIEPSANLSVLKSIYGWDKYNKPSEQAIIKAMTNNKNVDELISQDLNYLYKNGFIDDYKEYLNHLFKYSLGLAAPMALYPTLTPVEDNEAQ